MIGWVLFGSFFLLVFLNVPIAASLSLSALLCLDISNIDFSMFPNIMYSAMGKFTLLAIPFFILAGTIMEYAGISRRLINLAQVCVGHTKNGMILVVVIVSCFFAAISGSGPATVSALGAILIPAMVEAGYDRGVSTSLVSSAGGIGIIIPPSIAFVTFASVSDVSIGALFAGGVIPGIIVGIAYVFAARWASRDTRNIRHIPKASSKEIMIAFKNAIWGLLMPVIILGGIYGGIFTPTEAAGVAVVYGLVVGTLIYREIKIKDLWNIFVDSAISAATVMFIVGAASVFAWILTTKQIASSISNALLSVSSNKYILMILINIIFLVAGCFLEANSAYYILVPIMMPIITKFNINPIHFGVFATVNMAIGLVTPPVGLNLYVGCRVGNVGVAELSRKVIPFVLFGTIALAIITFIPGITMFLPNLLK